MNRLQRWQAQRKYRQQLAYWVARRDQTKIDWYDMRNFHGADMGPLNRVIAHADLMVGFFKRRLAELGEDG